jgi:hypothetical protein
LAAKLRYALILLTDPAIFDYRAINSSQRIAAILPYLRADHFGKPEDVFARLSKERYYLPGRRARTTKNRVALRFSNYTL